MPLIMAPLNVELEIRKMAVEDKTKKHLQEIGVSVGGKVTVVSSGAKGVIVIVKEGRLCLDGELAKKILVA